MSWTLLIEWTGYGIAAAIVGGIVFGVWLVWRLLRREWK